MNKLKIIMVLMLSFFSTNLICMNNNDEKTNSAIALINLTDKNITIKFGKEKVKEISMQPMSHNLYRFNPRQVTINFITKENSPIEMTPILEENYATVLIINETNEDSILEMKHLLKTATEFAEKTIKMRQNFNKIRKELSESNKKMLEELRGLSEDQNFLAFAGNDIYTFVEMSQDAINIQPGRVGEDWKGKIEELEAPDLDEFDFIQNELKEQRDTIYSKLNKATNQYTKKNLEKEGAMIDELTKKLRRVKKSGISIETTATIGSKEELEKEKLDKEAKEKLEIQNKKLEEIRQKFKNNKKKK